MEFYLEQEALDRATPTDSNVQKDEKTNKLFSELEQGLNEIYDKTSGNIKKVLSDNEGSEYIKLELPIGEKSTEKAQHILDTLDSNLASIENTANTYWNKVKTATFWSSLTEDVGSKLGTVVATASKGVSEIMNGTSTGKTDLTEANREEEGGKESEQRLALAGNRTEAELKELATNKSIYLEALEGKSFQKMDVTAKTDEINVLLKQDKDLQKLMSEIVPQDVSYEDFWSIYFTNREEILEKERKRKALLDKTVGKEVEEEEVSWDDDEEEDEDESNGSAQPMKSVKRDSNSDSRGDVAAKDSTNGRIEEEEEEDDDEDDGWE